MLELSSVAARWVLLTRIYMRVKCISALLQHFYTQGTAGTKIAALEAAGVTVTPSPAQMGTALVAKMKEANLA